MYSPILYCSLFILMPPPLLYLHLVLLLHVFLLLLLFFFLRRSTEMSRNLLSTEPPPLPGRPESNDFRQRTPPVRWALSFLHAWLESCGGTGRSSFGSWPTFLLDKSYFFPFPQFSMSCGRVYHNYDTANICISFRRIFTSSIFSHLLSFRLSRPVLSRSKSFQPNVFFNFVAILW